MTTTDIRADRDCLSQERQFTIMEFLVKVTLDLK